MKNKNVFRMVGYFFRSKKATIYAIIMCALGLLVGIVTPICNKAIQDDIIPNKNISLFIWLTVVILILNIVSTITSYMTTKIFVENGVPITSNIRKDIVKMNTLSDKNKDKKGKVLISSTAFLEEANSFYISYMYLIFDCLLKFMFFLPFFLIYGGHLAIVMLVATLLSFAFLDMIMVKSKQAIEVSKRVDSERYEYTLKMYKEIQKPDFEENEEFNLKTYMSKVHACDKAWIRYCNYANLYGYVFNLLWYAGIGVCLCVALNLVGAGIMLVSTFIVFNSYCEQLRVPIANYVTYKQISDRFDETFRNVFDLLDDEDLLDLKKD